MNVKAPKYSWRAGFSGALLLMALGSATPQDSSDQDASPPVNDDGGASYFYEDLSPYGKWHLDNGQWYWQPYGIVIGSNWTPYWDGGHWAYTDDGWTWVSDYEWGWAPFHYGRWLDDQIVG